MGLERPIPDEKEWSLASEIFSLPGPITGPKGWPQVRKGTGQEKEDDT